MTTICFGGVCIPYTAVLPLIALVLKWFAHQLAIIGFLPVSLAKKLGVQPSDVKATESVVDGILGTGSSKVGGIDRVSNEDSRVKKIDTVEGWKYELSSSNGQRPVVAKFTASWCKPCKTIDPFYSDLATRYDASFVKIDVDELDEIAAECNVAMMPTFVVFGGKERKGSVSGANEANLERLIREHCPKRIRA